MLYLPVPRHHLPILSFYSPILSFYSPGSGLRPFTTGSAHVQFQEQLYALRYAKGFPKFENRHL